VTQPNTTDLLKATLAKLHKGADAASAKSLRGYLDCVVADVVPEPKRYGLIEEGWQKERHERVIPAAEFICGLNPTYSGPLFFFECYQKGCDKSTTIARICDWLLAYSRKPLRMVAAAKDADQARVVYDAMYRTAHLNKPWLWERLEFKRTSVHGKHNGSRLDVVPADAGGIQGITPDVIVADELSAWVDHEFWIGLIGGAMKRSGVDPVTGKPKGHCLTYVITNAGLKGSWQWGIREEARTDPLWSFYEQPSYTVFPSWLSPQVISSVRRGMTEWEAKRLIDNVWLDPNESGQRYFSPDDITGCVGTPKEVPPGTTCYLGIDYGEKKDRTALAVIWMDDAGVVHVPELTVWQGRPDKPVLLEEVEQWVNLQYGRYPDAVAVFDPHQTMWLIQKLEKDGRPVRKFEFRSGKNNLLMGENLRTLMKNRKLCFSLHTGLIGGSTLADEFRQIIGQEKAYGVRMQHDRLSHDDRVCAVGMATLVAVQESVPGPVKQKGQEPAVLQEYNRPRVTNGFDRPHAARRNIFGIGSG
jgi:hypothetical protein